MRLDILKRKPEIEKWIEEKRSKAWIARQLECKIDTFNSWLDKMDICYSGNKGNKGHRSDTRRKTANEYLSSGSVIKSHRLKIKLLEDGIKEWKCEVCNNTEWNGQQIPLELHHIDGNHYNNELSNLQLICPNCHAFTPNHSGRGKRK